MPHTPHTPSSVPLPPSFPGIVAVTACYGGTMLAVQAFERTLAVALMVAELADTLSRHDPSKPLAWSTVQRRLRKTGNRPAHVFNRASAAELRNELRGTFDDTLVADIEPLIEWRDFLAHRYLIARVAQHGPTLVPKQEHIDELADLGEAFQAATRRVEAIVARIVESLEVPDRQNPGADEAFRRGVTTYTTALANQQPPRFQRNPPGRQ